MKVQFLNTSAISDKVSIRNNVFLNIIGKIKNKGKVFDALLTDLFNVFGYINNELLILKLRLPAITN